MCPHSMSSVPIQPKPITVTALTSRGKYTGKKHKPVIRPARISLKCNLLQPYCVAVRPQYKVLK